MPPDATICDVFIYDELSASAEESECSSWYRFRNRVGGNQATHERLLEALQVSFTVDLAIYSNGGLY